MYQYTRDNAKAYSTLGIQGTTYEAGFREAGKILGNLEGKVALDYGTGAGRTASLLRSFGATKVVGVDHNQAMIDQATAINVGGLEFVKVNGKLPFNDATFDLAFAAHVFVEVGILKEMRQICDEIHRVLKEDGIFVIIANNPQAIGCSYLSYGYPKPATPLKSGEKILCTIKKGSESFVIDDYYWSENDYKKVLEDAGFSVSMTFPLMTGDGWLDEAKVASHVVIKAIK